MRIGDFVTQSFSRSYSFYFRKGNLRSFCHNHFHDHFVKVGEQFRNRAHDHFRRDHFSVKELYDRISRGIINFSTRPFFSGFRFYSLFYKRFYSLFYKTFVEKKSPLFEISENLFGNYENRRFFAP